MIFYHENKFQFSYRGVKIELTTDQTEYCFESGKKQEYKAN